MDKIEPCVRCPKCGYLISILAQTLARYDYPCPGCEIFTISQFKTVRLRGIENVK